MRISNVSDELHQSANLLAKVRCLCCNINTIVNNDQLDFIVFCAFLVI